MSDVSAANTRVLVVDDDPMVRASYLKTLVETGEEQTSELRHLLMEDFDLGEDESELTIENAKTTFEVVVANSGEEAIEKFKEALSHNKPFSTVFMDVRMPPGMDGIECSGQLRMLDPRVYIVIVSAFSDYSLDEINTHIGYEFIYLRKPFVTEELYQVARAFSRMWGRDAMMREKVARLEMQLKACKSGQESD